MGGLLRRFRWITLALAILLVAESLLWVAESHKYNPFLVVGFVILNLIGAAVLFRLWREGGRDR
jgi:hypothetical protein